VGVASPGGADYTLILRLDRDPHDVNKEARILLILARCGLPVAPLLGGPVRDSEQPALGVISVLALLPGDTLLDHAWHVPASHHERIEQLVMEAVLRLHSLTATLAHEPADAGAWQNVAAFAEGRGATSARSGANGYATGV
jgi:hypothetical protein